MADELKPAYLIGGNRPPEGRPRGRAAARPLRGRRGRAARRGRDHGRRRRRRLQRARPVRLGRAGSSSSTDVEALEGAGREGDRRLPQVAGARHDARARRRRAEEGRTAREGGRRPRRGAALGRPERGPSPRWVAEQFKLRGATADPEACRAADRARRRRPLRARERGRQARDVGGRRQDQRRRRRGARRARGPSRRRGTSTDAWGARDVGGVLRASEHMLERTGDPRSRTIPRLVGSLTSHVARIARAGRRLETKGLSDQDAAARLGIKPYPAQKLYAQVRNFSGRELDDAIDPAGRARPRAEGRLAARGRARARAGARRDHAAALAAARRASPARP